MKTIARWIRHNQGLALALAISIGLLFWVYGCASVVDSITTPEKKVSRIELEIEVEAEIARLESELNQLQKLAEARVADLDRQDKLKQGLANLALTVAEGGTINPTGIVTSLVALLGVGAAVDNRIKDKVIKNRPLKA